MTHRVVLLRCESASSRKPASRRALRFIKPVKPSVIAKDCAASQARCWCNISTAILATMAPTKQTDNNTQFTTLGLRISTAMLLGSTTTIPMRAAMAPAKAKAHSFKSPCALLGLAVALGGQTRQHCKACAISMPCAATTISKWLEMPHSIGGAPQSSWDTPKSTGCKTISQTGTGRCKYRLKLAWIKAKVSESKPAVAAQAQVWVAWNKPKTNQALVCVAPLSTHSRRPVRNRAGRANSHNTTVASCERTKHKKKVGAENIRKRF